MATSVLVTLRWHSQSQLVGFWLGWLAGCGVWSLWSWSEDDLQSSVWLHDTTRHDMTLTGTTQWIHTHTSPPRPSIHPDRLIFQSAWHRMGVPIQFLKRELSKSVSQAV